LKDEDVVDEVDAGSVDVSTMGRTTETLPFPPPPPPPPPKNNCGAGDGTDGTLVDMTGGNGAGDTVEILVVKRGMMDGAGDEDVGCDISFPVFSATGGVIFSVLEGRTILRPLTKRFSRTVTSAARLPLVAASALSEAYQFPGAMFRYPESGSGSYAIKPPSVFCVYIAR
jgi:hypothetical protein